MRNEEVQWPRKQNITPSLSGGDFPPLVSKISENLILWEVIGPGRLVSLATIFLSQPLHTSPPLSLYRGSSGCHGNEDLQPPQLEPRDRGQGEGGPRTRGRPKRDIRGLAPCQLLGLREQRRLFPQTGKGLLLRPPTTPRVLLG